MIDKKELRRLAENAREYIAYSGNRAEFREACDPATVIALLDEIDRLKAGWESSHKNYVEAVTR